VNRPDITEAIGRSSLLLANPEPMLATLLYPGCPSYFRIVMSIPKKDYDVARSRNEIADRRVSLRAPVAIR